MRTLTKREVTVMELELEALEMLQDEDGLTGGCGSWSCLFTHYLI
jgi:hypothetical protein